MESQRGQTLPLTLGGIIAMIVFGLFAVNYANTLRWQVRAQSAADSAAQAILSLQTQQFNEMTAILYATAVEEYRIRHLLNGMVLAAHFQGGCKYGTLATNAANSVIRGTQPTGCDYIETTLEAQYDAAVGRYTADVLMLHRISATMSFASFTTDAKALLAQISACSGTSPFRGDCAFSYGAPIITPRIDMEAVYMDANGVLLPSPSNPTALASSVGTPPLNTGTSSLFSPAQVEVYACARVPAIIPNILGWQFPTFTAVARGAATPVMVEQDWLQPGAISNPYSTGLSAQTGQKYQPIEKYLSGSATVSDSSGYDWYDLNFAGNGNVVVGGLHISSALLVDEFSVYVGWWNAIPIHAFTPQKSTAAMGCTS